MKELFMDFKLFLQQSKHLLILHFHKLFEAIFILEEILK